MAPPPMKRGKIKAQVFADVSGGVASFATRTVEALGFIRNNHTSTTTTTNNNNNGDGGDGDVAGGGGSSPPPNNNNGP